MEFDVNVFEAILSIQRFSMTKYREVLVKYSLLITHAGMSIWHQLREQLTDSFFK